MATYVTNYVLGQAVVNPPGAMSQPVGVTDDGYTVFAMLVSARQSEDYVWNGLDCYEGCSKVGVYAGKDHLFDEYPEMETVDTIETGDGPVAVSRLSGGWA